MRKKKTKTKTKTPKPPKAPDTPKTKVYGWMRKPDYPVMTPYEYDQARIHYDLPSTRFAMLLGVGWRQGQRYRDGEVDIPEPVAKLIRTALRHKLRKDEIG